DGEEHVPHAGASGRAHRGAEDRGGDPVGEEGLQLPAAVAPDGEAEPLAAGLGDRPGDGRLQRGSEAARGTELYKPRVAAAVTGGPSPARCRRGRWRRGGCRP